MFEQMLDKIKQYNHIVLYRHINPDFDAFGSQFGLYDIIKFTYPDKFVYLAGDFSSDLVSKYDFEVDGLMPDFKNNQVLGIVLDTGNVERIDGDYSLCNELIKVDHHIVEDSYGNINIEDASCSSTSQLIGQLLNDYNDELMISLGGANALYLGIIGDTNRFLFRNTDERTFEIAALLVKQGINIDKLYQSIYLKKAVDLEVNKFILNNYKVDGNVAYYILNDDDLKQLNISREQGSNYVNMLSGIEEYYVWIAITQNSIDNNWRVSMRSRNVVINEVAKKYRGGGHALACGATLDNIDELSKLISDVKEKINE